MKWPQRYWNISIELMSSTSQNLLPQSQILTDLIQYHSIPLLFEVYKLVLSNKFTISLHMLLYDFFWSKYTLYNSALNNQPSKCQYDVNDRIFVGVIITLTEDLSRTTHNTDGGNDADTDWNGWKNIKWIRINCESRNSVRHGHKICSNLHS